MSKYDAKIECVVNRPFLHLGVKFEKGDIFSLNPNNRLHKVFLSNGKVYQLPEEHYEYVCTISYKEFGDKIYGLNDLVDFSDLSDEYKVLYVKRGWVKKSIKKTEEKEEKVSYTAYAKTKGMTYSELRALYKEKTDEYIPHHASAVSKEMFEKLEKVIPVKKELEDGEIDANNK